MPRASRSDRRASRAPSGATIGAVPDTTTLGPRIGAQIDIAIAQLAANQHGRVARRQLLALGIGRRAIAHRVAAGRLICVARGVYAPGHRVESRHARWMTSVLAAGPDALLSHRGAGAAYALKAPERLEVTAPSRRRVAGVLVHVSAVPFDERDEIDGVPATSVARTLLDLAGVLRPHQLRRAVNEAEFLRLTSPVGLPTLLDRHPRRPGAAALRAILSDQVLGADVDESELEDDFRGFLDQAGLPQPLWHEPIEGYVPDCVWPRHRLIVELDGRGAHGTRRRFEGDRLRDLRLEAAGWTVVRITWRMLHRERRTLERSLRALLQIDAAA